ncbi:bifunctional tetrahydrofolate synthase/dihydrofolate synthase [Arsenophonus endosymbiont of Aleurodicus floccissimus]|uniref:bifunctional tetrahydrofolate synthase/dihydrofolate synthase n=1 Tax=Arsenophonus endosymbiont of Aleurodicus floccissimus TaxID=2152761 RepID=UPI003F72BFEC
MSETLMIPGVTSSLATWLTYLTRQHSKIIDMGLERVGVVARQLDLLYPAPKVVTVAGTNGKGTTCHTLESILIEAGLKVGVYSSPHLLDYTERVRIQGKMLPEAEFCRVFVDIESKRGTTTLTYFEYGTLAALQLFKQAKLDVVILEVGLGGRLDATNIVDADIAAITSIALDHTDWLGGDREQIGYEKAGIFRSGRYAVVGEPDMPQSINEVAQTLESKLFRCGVDWQFELQNDHWHWRSHDHDFKQLPVPNVALANAATALAIIDCLIKQGDAIGQTISLPAIQQGLIKAKLPGRFQIICEQPCVILDVAHNPHAAAYLADKLARLPRQKNTKVHAVVAMLADKEIKSTLSYLAAQVDKWYLASLIGIRGADVAQLAQYVESSYQFATVKDAWLQAMAEADKQDIVLVCGSFHTVAEVMELQTKEENLSGQ